MSKTSSSYAEYAILKERIKILTNQAEAVAKILIEEINATGQPSLETTVGKFTVSKRKTWTYPENIVELGETLKAEQAKAQSTGDATYEEKDSLLFTAVKL